MQIHDRGLQFDSPEVKKQEKGWDHVNINMETIPTMVLHEFHQYITSELKEHEQRTSHLNIQLEQERVALKKQLD